MTDGATDAAPLDADGWITSFAAALGVDAPDRATVDALLELAGVAAHASERVAAPIACYLTGIAGRAVDEAIEAAERVG